ncbi:MAG: prepilin-type N-terminal cleavage/methylation domain-containing protein [Verrucomicrobiota bacterium]
MVMWRHNKSHKPVAGKIRGLQDAFSLMELLVVIAIMGLIALVVLSAVRGGLRIYDRVKAGSNQQLEVLLAMEAMEKRIRNACPFAGIGFNGDEQQFSFPALVSFPAQTNMLAVPLLCQVTYHYTAMSNSLTEKIVCIHPRLDAGSSIRGNAFRELARLDEFKFSYCYRDAKTWSCAWKNSWCAREGLPLGVKLVLNMRSGDRRTSLERTVWLPVAH